MRLNNFMERSRRVAEKNRDKTVYRLRHKDGRVVQGTRLDISKVTNLTTEDVGALARGRRTMVKEWMNAEHSGN